MQLVLIPGDGIGPEVTGATRRVVAATGTRIDWVEAPAGLDAARKLGDPLPESTLDLIRKHRVALKGPCTTPVGQGFRSINVRLRQGLDLYASVRPVTSLPGVKTPFEDVDLVVVRENTEGLYAGLEHVVVPGVVESLRVVTRPAAERIVRFAFELARREDRRQVTFCHKADVLRLSDGLFLDCARQVADEFPFIEFEARRIDNLCMELVLHPERFDVLVMENLFGDVISDLCAGLVGGLGLVPGANVGARYAVFEAVHGSAPDIAGKGLANPIAVVRSAAMMLDHVGQRDAGRRIEAAVLRTLERGVGLTRDLGLFASVRPIRNLAGLPSRFENLDVLLVREITEDLYTAIEHEIVPGVVQSLKVVTEAACLRFFRFGFELARKQGRKSVHCIHKANILKLADGLFLECFRRVAAQVPEIRPLEMIVDNACMQLASRPQQFEVLVAGNLYGDLLSDLGAGLIGGISATAAVSHGDGVRVYEAIHGGTRDAVGGADRANPLPLLSPALEMLCDLGEVEPSRRIRRAVETVLT